MRALTRPDFDGAKMVFLPPEAKSLVAVTNQTAARVLNSQFKAQRVDIEVEAAGPSLVVVAQTYYRNWRVYVNDEPTHMLRANYAFQAFQVPAGRHHVRLVYEDRAFQFGAVVSACLAACCLVLLCRPGKRISPANI